MDGMGTGGWMRSGRKTTVDSQHAVVRKSMGLS